MLVFGVNKFLKILIPKKTGPQNERFGRWAPTNDEGGLAGLRRGAWQGKIRFPLVD